MIRILLHMVCTCVDIRKHSLIVFIYILIQYEFVSTTVVNICFISPIYTTHTTVSWPNPKQQRIESYFRSDYDYKMKFEHSACAYLMNCKAHYQCRELGRVDEWSSVNWVSIGSDNGLSPLRRHAITWTNADLLSFGPLRKTVSEIRIEIQNFSVMKMHWNISSAKWRPFCPGGDELIQHVAAAIRSNVLTEGRTAPYHHVTDFRRAYKNYAIIWTKLPPYFYKIALVRKWSSRDLAKKRGTNIKCAIKIWSLSLGHPRAHQYWYQR